MKKIIKVIIIMMIGTAWLNISTLNEIQAQSKIDNLLERTANRQGIPGISVAITGYNSETIFSSYGLARRGGEVPINEDTFFGLGSVSKAFSALSVLYLDENNEFDFRIEDPIQKHIPWLNFNYQDLDFDMKELTIANFIYHTSGLVNAIHSLSLPPSHGSDASQKIVEILNNSQLEFRPGARYDYASSNYIILGLVIQNVTGMSFEEFTTTRILQPLNLSNTFMFHSDAEEVGTMASAHKPIWFVSRPFNPPTFQAHTPTGFIISNAYDMSNWINLILNPENAPAPFNTLLVRALEANKEVDAWEGYYYAAGWLIEYETGKIRHQGESPGFMSEVVIFPESGIGIVVLKNSLAGDTANLIANILLILDGIEAVYISAGSEFILFDTIFAIVIWISTFAIIILTLLVVKKIVAIKNNSVDLLKPRVGNIINIAFALSLFMISLIVTLLFPSFFGVGTWAIANIWIAYTVLKGLILLMITSILWIILASLGIAFNKPKRKI